MSSSKAFLDTTILAEVLLKPGARRATAQAAIKRFTESQTPGYAIKEFKWGPFSHYCWLHNKFVTEKVFSNVIAAIHSIYRQRGLQGTALEALGIVAKSIGSRTIADLEAQYGPMAKEDELRADVFRLALKAIILKAWKRRRAVADVVEPLTCYAEIPPNEARGGLIDAHPFDCTLEDSCCMGPRFRSRPNEVEALKNAMEKIRDAKAENRRRYQALRSLYRTPKRPLTREHCRNLGDAVFAFFAPAEATILTTNVKDHEPLASALGKRVESP